MSGREDKKREIKLLVHSDELVEEVEELVLDAGVPAGVLLKPASEFEPSVQEVEGAALEVEPPVRGRGSYLRSGATSPRGKESHCR